MAGSFPRRRRGARGLVCGLVGAFALLAASGAARAAEDCFVVTDLESGRVLAKQGLCATRHTPASTFKIALALMGFDAGILKGPKDPVLEPGPDADTSREVTRGPQTPESWMRNSVVWYSQDLVRQLGAARVQHYLDTFPYGSQNMSGTKGGPEALTHFWLSSSLQISPREQVDFLRRMLKDELPVTPAAVNQTMQLLLQEEQPAGWTLFGKTGTGSSLLSDGKPDPHRPLGWFVGFAQKSGHTAVFVRFLSRDVPSSQSLGLLARKQAINALAAVLAAQPL